MLLWVWIVEGIWHRCIWRLSSSALQLWNCRSLHKLRQKRRELSFAYLLPMLASLTVSLDRSWACSLSTWDMTESLLVMIVEVIFSGFLSANSNVLLKEVCIKLLCLCSRNLELIPGLGRSPGEEHSDPLQYSYLENSMDRGAWQATVHGGHRELYTTEQLTFSLSRKLRKNHRAICGPSGDWGPQRELYFYTTEWCRKLRNLSQPLLWQATIWDYLTPGAFLQDPQWEMDITSVWDFWKSPEEEGLIVSICSYSPLSFLLLTPFWQHFIQTDVGFLPLIQQVSFVMSLLGPKLLKITIDFFCYP